MTDTTLIWYNPDIESYELGPYYDYKVTSSASSNEDRFEVIYEFCIETIEVADKILSSLNKVRSISSPLNL